MRLSNEQKQIAREAVSSAGLPLDNVQIVDNDTQISFQFRGREIHFRITKVDLRNYQYEFNTVSNAQERRSRAPWNGTIDLLKSWTRGIVRDEQFAPTAEKRLPEEGQYASAKIVSERFKKCFGQALETERLGLDEVAGMAFRRAAEVLVKDYLAARHADFADRVHGLPLAQTIEEFGPEPAFKVIAKACAWLGNDFSHTVRLWTELSIPNLKDYIDKTVKWIELYEDISAVGQEMGEPRRPKIAPRSIGMPGPSSKPANKSLGSEQTAVAELRNTLNAQLEIMRRAAERQAWERRLSICPRIDWSYGGQVVAQYGGEHQQHFRNTGAVALKLKCTSVSPDSVRASLDLQRVESGGEFVVRILSEQLISYPYTLEFAYTDIDGSQYGQRYDYGSSGYGLTEPERIPGNDPALKAST